MTAKLLQGVQVVELGGGVAAGYAGKLLHDLGAQVLRFARPVAETLSPLIEAYLHSGKDIGVDLPEQAVLNRADIFLSDLSLADRRALGFDPQQLSEQFPRLVVGAATIFGDRDDASLHNGCDIDAQAQSGVAWILGEPGRPPLILPYDHARFQAGVHLAGAALMALLARGRTGRGQVVDIAATDVLSAAVGTNAMLYLYDNLQSYDRAGRRAYASGGPYPYVILPCKDGEVCLVGRARQEWERLVEAMGSPAWSADPRYQDLRIMGREYPEEVDNLIRPWLAQHTRGELLALAERYGFPIGPVYTTDETVTFDQFAHRGFFHTRDGVRMPREPWVILQ